MQVWKIEQDATDFEKISQAAAAIRQGQLVAFPTETVYGLGGDGLNPNALKAIFAAKGRPADNPLILHIHDLQELPKIAATIPPKAELLMEAFWPGPLTLVFPKTDQVPLEATGGLDTVAVRMPDHDIARRIIQMAGTPIAAPSANLSGKPSPTSARDVLEDFQDRIAGVVDGGVSSIGLESTVVDCTGEVPVILRPGGITMEMLTQVVGQVQMDTHLLSEETPPKAPGMKYTHYAPKAKMILLEDAKDLEEALNYGDHSDCKVAFFLPEDRFLEIQETPTRLVFRAGREGDWSLLAQRFYQYLREADRQKVAEIFSLMVPEKDLGAAIMNRMKKSAGYHLWKDRRESES